MAMILKVSNSLQSLAQGLAISMQQQKLGVFEPNTIITQTQGMNNWLNLQFAEHLGIAANINYFTPNQLIQKVYSLLGNRFNEVLDASNIRWLLFSLLGKEEFITAFPEVAFYYQHSDSEMAIEQKKYSLANKLADLFDQYQIYRPEMIEEWNAGKSTEETAWQAWLWQHANEVTQQKLPDKARIGSYIIKALKDPQATISLQSKLPVIHVFGLSIFTQYHLNLLHEIAQVVEVQLHILNPAPMVYWQDDKTPKAIALYKKRQWKLADTFMEGNALLTSWGKVVNDAFKMFYEIPGLLDTYETQDVAEPSTDTLLHTLQHDIFNAATDMRNPIDEALLNDGSITINTCYTPMREVESLYNYLVHLYDVRKVNIAPKDIVVMVQNIDTYAPYIRAVFGHAKPRFRYTIADESMTMGDHPFEALHVLLSLYEENCTPENVLQLLDYSCIRERFHIEDRELIRALLEKANIRFGFTGDEQTQTWSVSWAYGLQRLLYGICMSGTKEYNAEPYSLYPLDAAEGLKAHEVMRFIHFMKVLISAIEERKQARSLLDWSTYLQTLIQNFLFRKEVEGDETYRALQDQMAGYARMQEWMDEKISFDVWAQHMKQSLESYTKSNLFLSGGITFCSLIPMRSIPFKVVALLGMDFNNFPRKEKKQNFDLMLLSPKMGDRNVKDNDKHLFLETLLSAQEYFYISYQGFSAKDNAPLPPSALVDELIDYITSGVSDENLDVRKILTTVQPLHMFSQQYALNTSLYNYLQAQEGQKVAIWKDEESAAWQDVKDISVTDLLRFFRHPIKYYFNSYLNIYYEDQDEEIPDTEIFQLNHLENRNLKDQWFDAHEERSTFVQTSVRKGLLPLSNSAEAAVRNIENEVQLARNLWQQVVAGQTKQQMHINLKVGAYNINGSINDVYDDKLVQIVWSKIAHKYFFRAGLQLVLMTCASKAHEAYIVHTQSATLYKASITNEQAQILLEAFIEIFNRGSKQIWPFIEEAAAAAQPKKLNSFTAILEDLLFGYTSHFNDVYVTHAYENNLLNDEDFDNQFQEALDTIYFTLIDMWQAV